MLPGSAGAPISICFSPEISDRLREYAEEMGLDTIDALTRDLEETVRRRLLLHQTEKIRDRFADMTPEQVDDLVEEALAWARSPEGRACE